MKATADRTRKKQKHNAEKVASEIEIEIEDMPKDMHSYHTHASPSGSIGVEVGRIPRLHVLCNLYLAKNMNLCNSFHRHTMLHQYFGGDEVLFRQLENTHRALASQESLSCADTTHLLAYVKVTLLKVKERYYYEDPTLYDCWRPRGERLPRQDKDEAKVAATAAPNEPKAENVKHIVSRKVKGIRFRTSRDFLGDTEYRRYDDGDEDDAIADERGNLERKIVRGEYGLLNDLIKRVSNRPHDLSKMVDMHLELDFDGARNSLSEGARLTLVHDTLIAVGSMRADLPIKRIPCKDGTAWLDGDEDAAYELLEKSLLEKICHLEERLRGVRQKLALVQKARRSKAD
jgi:hypothetical protein